MEVNETMRLEYSIVILAIAIAISGFWIGNALQQSENVEIFTQVNEKTKNLTLSEASTYLKISEESIKKIIIQENQYLIEYGSFSGRMFPYSIVYGEYLFTKQSLDEWMEELTKRRQEYSVEGIKQ